MALKLWLAVCLGAALAAAAPGCEAGSEVARVEAAWRKTVNGRAKESLKDIGRLIEEAAACPTWSEENRAGLWRVAAEVAWSAGRGRQAETYARRFHEEAARLWGEDSMEAGLALECLARMLATERRWYEVQEPVHGAIERLKQAPRGRGADALASAYHTLAVTQLALGNDIGAERNLRRGLEAAPAGASPAVAAALRWRLAALEGTCQNPRKCLKLSE